MSEWNTECGVHHGWLFVAGVFFGLALVASAGILVIPYV